MRNHSVLPLPVVPATSMCALTGFAKSANFSDPKRSTPSGTRDDTSVRGNWCRTLVNVTPCRSLRGTSIANLPWSTRINGELSSPNRICKSRASAAIRLADTPCSGFSWYRMNVDPADGWPTSVTSAPNSLQTLTILSPVRSAPPAGLPASLANSIEFATTGTCPAASAVSTSFAGPAATSESGNTPARRPISDFSNSMPVFNSWLV